MTWTAAAGSRVLPPSNFHRIFPHYAVTTSDNKSIRVLARQPIDMSHPHPFYGSGKPRVQHVSLDGLRTANAPGDILLADSTIFTTLFGGDESLERFWKNIVTK